MLYSNCHIYFTLKSFKVRGNKYGSSNKKGYTVQPCKNEFGAIGTNQNPCKNDHICEEFKKFNLHPINNTEGFTYNQYFKKYCKRRTGGKKKVDVVSEMGEKDFYLDKLSVVRIWY